MKLMDVIKKAFTGAGRIDSSPGPTRRVPPTTYSRANPNPAWGDKRPGPRDRVVGSQIVAPDSPLPPGERLTLNEWTVGNIESGDASASSISDGISADFFAARQALANRRLR